MGGWFEFFFDIFAKFGNFGCLAIVQPDCNRPRAGEVVC